MAVRCCQRAGGWPVIEWLPDAAFYPASQMPLSICQRLAEHWRAADCLQPALALRLPAAADPSRWAYSGR